MRYCLPTWHIAHPFALGTSPPKTSFPLAIPELRFLITAVAVDGFSVPCLKHLIEPSRLRLLMQVCQELIASGPTVIRGNASEILAAAGAATEATRVRLASMYCSPRRGVKIPIKSPLRLFLLHPTRHKTLNLSKPVKIRSCVRLAKPCDLAPCRVHVRGFGAFPIMCLKTGLCKRSVPICRLRDLGPFPPVLSCLFSGQKGVHGFPFRAFSDGTSESQSRNSKNHITCQSLQVFTPSTFNSFRLFEQAGLTALVLAPSQV